MRESADAWLAMSVEHGTSDGEFPSMTYILWDDEAILRFFALYEPDLWVPVNMLPHPVERTDIFRVAVLKWFGGVVCLALLVEFGRVKLMLYHSTPTLTHFRSNTPPIGFIVKILNLG